jgi:hypothetical protein
MYDWLMLIPGLWILLEGSWRWHRLTGTAARLSLARALFGLGFLLASTKAPTMLGVSEWSLGFSVIGISAVLAGLVLQGRAVGSSYRSIGIMVGSIVALMGALAAGLFLPDLLGVDSILARIGILMIPLALVGGITIRLLRDDPPLGMPVRFRRTTSES